MAGEFENLNGHISFPRDIIGPKQARPRRRTMTYAAFPGDTCVKRTGIPWAGSIVC